MIMKHDTSTDGEFTGVWHSKNHNNVVYLQTLNPKMLRDDCVVCGADEGYIKDAQGRSLCAACGVVDDEGINCDDPEG